MLRREITTVIISLYLFYNIALSETVIYINCFSIIKINTMLYILFYFHRNIMRNLKDLKSQLQIQNTLQTLIIHTKNSTEPPHIMSTLSTILLKNGTETYR